jgi:hypothetical protein
MVPMLLIFHAGLFVGLECSHSYVTIVVVLLYQCVAKEKLRMTRDVRSAMTSNTNNEGLLRQQHFSHAIMR